MEFEQQGFVSLIEEVDRSLIGYCVAVPGRPIRAIIEILNAHQASGPMFHPLKTSLHYPVTEFNLTDHVHAWYQERYGEKLKIDPSPGRFPFVIEAEPYICRLPLAVGSFHLLSSKNRFADRSIMNAVDFIQHLPELVRARLDPTIENQLLPLFTTCMEVTKDLRRLNSNLSASSKSDILISCDLLTSSNRNPALSTWHSQQFTEKSLKEFISRFRAYRKIHTISKLRDCAMDCGYVPDNSIQWELFNFSAEVRYDSKRVALEEAVKINHEAWRVGFNVLKQLPS